MPSDFDLDRIRERLAAHVPRLQDRPDIVRRAAVAAILRPGTGDRAGDTDVLLIRRADRAGDPWSGHMAFPGGHKDPTDVDLLATAVRETSEEVGLDLREHRCLGQLDEVPAMARGRFVGMAVAPFVFELKHDVTFSPNYEVAEVVWGGLGQMASGEIDVTKELTYDGELLKLPGFRVQQHVVWGLTHHMLRSLLTTIRPPA